MGISTSQWTHFGAAVSAKTDAANAERVHEGLPIRPDGRQVSVAIVGITPMMGDSVWVLLHHEFNRFGYLLQAAKVEAQREPVQHVAPRSLCVEWNSANSLYVTHTSRCPVTAAADNGLRFFLITPVVVVAEGTGLIGQIM